MNDKEYDDQVILSQIGQQLRRARLNADIGQDELAQQTGLSRKTIQNAEAGNNYSMETLIRILRGLNIVQYLDSFFAEISANPNHNTHSYQEQPSRKKQQVRQRASSRVPEEHSITDSNW